MSTTKILRSILRISLVLATISHPPSSHGDTDDVPIFSETWFLSKGEEGIDTLADNLVEKGRSAVETLALELACTGLGELLPGGDLLTEALCGEGSRSDEFALHAEKILESLEALEITVLGAIDERGALERAVELQNVITRVRDWGNRNTFIDREAYYTTFQLGVIEPLIDLVHAHNLRHPDGTFRYGVDSLHHLITAVGLLLPLYADEAAHRHEREIRAGESSDLARKIEENVSLVLGDKTWAGLFDWVAAISFPVEFSKVWSCEDSEGGSWLASTCHFRSLTLSFDSVDGSRGGTDYSIVAVDDRVIANCFQIRGPYDYDVVPVPGGGSVYGYDGSCASPWTDYMLSGHRCPEFSCLHDAWTLRDRVASKKYEDFLIESYGAVRPTLDEWWRSTGRGSLQVLPVDAQLDAAVFAAIGALAQSIEYVNYLVVGDSVEYLTDDQSILTVSLSDTFWSLMAPYCRDPSALDYEARRTFVNEVVLDGIESVRAVLAVAQEETLDPIATAAGGMQCADVLLTLKTRMSVDDARSFYIGKFLAKLWSGGIL